MALSIDPRAPARPAPALIQPGRPGEPGPAPNRPQAALNKLEEMSGLSEPAPSGNPDDSMCKLSLTRDEKAHPRVHKGPFGFEFDPCM